MKKIVLLFSLMMLSTRIFASEGALETKKQGPIVLQTDSVTLVLTVGDNGRLYQSYLGAPIHQSDAEALNGGKEAYMTFGLEDYFEPALRITHPDANQSTLLRYKDSKRENLGSGVERVTIELADDKYPIKVNLVYTLYKHENIFVTNAIIKNEGKKSVVMYKYASSMLHIKAPKLYLTDFTGNWANEVNLTTRELHFGKQIVDTKLGARAAMMTSPFFIVSENEKLHEADGTVLLGTLAWTGNFRFTFEKDETGNLRIISGINPEGSEYTLLPGESFTTPDFIFTLSNHGTGEASRDIHRWAKSYRLKDGTSNRMTLLNNWENTYFNFNQNSLRDLMGEASDIGVDMFLLDDGWFANKYPRSSDNAGLGDWCETTSKLPDGIGYLTHCADSLGLKFGLWIEPEMVNPKSELFEKHPDWAITLPNRDTYYFRNQLVLDMSNPKVQDYVFGIVDGLLTKYLDIAYFKWDCNSPITNIYSHYLKDKQSHLYVEYVRGLYNVLERIKSKYPNVPMMLCSGGGARCDYEALKYFTEFWASDNTDPIERLFIQWGFLYFMPSKAIAAHVTSWGRQPLKFRTDVAMMCKLGFDISIRSFEQQFVKSAVKNYNDISPIIFDGDLYRLSSPSTQHCAVMYASPDKNSAVLYAYDMEPRFDSDVFTLKLQGLDADTLYRLDEINLAPGDKSSLSFNGKTFSGRYLMNVGLNIFTPSHFQSHILTIKKDSASEKNIK